MRNVSMRMLAAATGVICALGMVTGCGGKDSTGAASSTTAAADPAEEYNLRFAQCLRDAGFDVSDPSNNKDVRNESAGGDAAAFNEAAQKCQEKLGPPPGGDGVEDLNNPGFGRTYRNRLKGQWGVLDASRLLLRRLLLLLLRRFHSQR